MSEISLHINPLLRHRHILEKGCQQADFQLIELVEMKRFILQYNFEQLLIKNNLKINKITRNSIFSLLQEKPLNLW